MRSVSEKIDERILRLLGLEDVFDIDYDTYLTLLKEAIVAGSKKLPQEELALLANERKRIRGKKGRFSPKKDKITADKVATTKLLRPAKKTLALAPSSTTSVEGEGGSFIGIKKTLDSILKTLGDKFKFDKKQSDTERKEKETEKRGKRESTLEGFKKGVAGIVATTKKMLSPFQAIIDRIWRFIFFTLLGRAFTKFMEWMSDKKNQDKFNAFIEFLSDHWPALAGLYILFGTSFGKLVRGLLKGATRMIVALLMNIGKIKRFIGKHKNLARLGIMLAPLATRELGNLLGENKETPESGLIPRDGADLGDAKKSVDQAANTQVPKFNFGGMVPKFNLGGMIPTFKMGGIPSPFGMERDSIPIQPLPGGDNMLAAVNDEEAILTKQDQKDISRRYVDRNTGQPLNIPQYLSGRKPGSVAMSNIRFPGFVGGFSSGGMISKFNNGGMVGDKNKIQNPKISTADYNALLAISALEDTNPQGRADVAQSLYNRMFASQKYGINFNQRSGALKDLITAGGGRTTDGQYEPTFDNKSDWLNIKDKMSAAVAIMNSTKGKKYKWTIKDAMDQLNATEAALKNPAFQSAAQKHVGGRTYFLGTSQQENMRPGDVLRSPEQNFFSPWYTEGTIYDKQRRNIAAPIPEMLLPPKPLQNKPQNQNIFQNVFSGIKGFFGPSPSTAKPQKTPSKPQRWAIDPRGWFGMQSGGLIKENTGMNIKGATADRQAILAQPGEFVIPKDSVDRLGTSFFEKLVAMTDSNSNAYLGRGTTGRRPQITPYTSFGSGPGGMITLPPITQSAGGSRARSAGLGGGSEVPEFSATAPNNERAMNASIYGLVG